MHAGATTPAETGRCPCRSLPGQSAAFPFSQEGRLPQHPFRGLLSVHSRSGLHGRRAAQGGPLPVCFNPCRYLHEPLWPLPAGATVAGWDSHPPGKRAFPRRTEKSGLVPDTCAKAASTTSRGWSVSSAAQSRNDDRPHAARPRSGTSRAAQRIRSPPSALPRSVTNTIGLPPPPSLRAASRISRARPHSGTRCSRAVFIGLAGIVHTPSVRSISLHTAARTSPPPLRPQHQELKCQGVHLAWVRRPHLVDGRRHLPVGQGSPASDDAVLGAEHRQQPVARVVRSPVHGDGPFQHGSDAQMHRPRLRPLRVQRGVRISSTSALVTSETGNAPMRGKAYRSKLRNQFLGVAEVRHPARFCSTTRFAASAKVGMPMARCFSARGFSPARASLRLSSACSRASLETRRALKLISRWTTLLGVQWGAKVLPWPRVDAGSTRRRECGMTEETFRKIFQAEAEGQGRRSRVPPSLDAQSDGAGGDSDVQERISAIERAASALQADVFFLSGPINRIAADRLREAHGSSNGRERCLLILSTSGGDADAAYLMARFLRGVYKHLTICVLGYCKSAGTLLALGGHEVSMGLRGELGPLDVQISKKDELVQSGSGLDIFTSLNVLAETAFSSFFQSYLVNTISRSEGQISTKTAADIATKLTVGMVAPIAAQIDPMRLGRERRRDGYRKRVRRTTGNSCRSDCSPDHRVSGSWFRDRLGGGEGASAPSQGAKPRRTRIGRCVG